MATYYIAEDEAHRSFANGPLRLRGSQISADLRETYEKALRDASEKVDTHLRQARLGEWKVLKVKEPMVLQAPDQTYYIRAEFCCSPQVLFDAAWRDVLRWNSQLVEARVIATIDSVTDLYYSMTAPALKGYVSSRDFFDVRRIHFDSGVQTYSGVFVSVESPACPVHANKKIVRGNNGPSCIRAVGDIASGQSYLEWIMRTDLKGGLPKRLVQSTMLTYFIEHISRLREYIDRQSLTRVSA
ncbi:START domain protein [Ancylostoma caninum]|uniref:START domain protein n=1 Tax=Ancylostoma caninum TaxID=29170 RepID=A0A368H1C2_ANCCA|nr:START domain protein [Ancylostoma caninum]